jgi:hypothetical protein
MSQPVTLSARALLLLVLGLAVLSAAAALGAASLARPDSADAASATSSAQSPGERAIVSQLKTLNRSVGSLEDRIGTSPYSSGSLRSDLRSYFGITGDIRGLLEDTCRNTQDINPPGAPCF